MLLFFETVGLTESFCLGQVRKPSVGGSKGWIERVKGWVGYKFGLQKPNFKWRAKDWVGLVESQGLGGVQGLR